MSMMEEDERELDIESEEEEEEDLVGDYLVVSGGGSRSLVSSGSGNGKGGKRRERGQVLDKRAHHNALERKRRDHIKDSFSGLRDAIPIMAGDKSSRAQILKKASDYICYMRKKTATHSEDIDDLKRQNMHLEEQIRALERAKNMGGSLSSSDVVLANAGLQQGGADSGNSNSSTGSSSSNTSLLVSLNTEAQPIKIPTQTTSRRVIVPGQSLLIPKDNNSVKEKVKVEL
eukprot:TRINITY_DN2025_c0_g1_i1.p1 TRINITY_DN2025_c0_g1~~TRINITY_DN2025_c0_g1_i1.p1  ORF type:complete len:230 (-),score=99.00 TRINITY_DN2025_c0_g1_i1:392-1081(-)